MSLADDLRDKLEQTTANLANLAQKLDDVESLGESLREASGGLAQTSSGISELAASARAAQESLGATLKALEQVTSAMMRLEPAVITSAIQATDTSIKAAIKDRSKELSLLVSEQSQAISQSIVANREVTQQMREKAAHQTAVITSAIQATDTSIKAAIKDRSIELSSLFKWIGSLTLFALTALVVLTIYILVKMIQ